MPYLMGGYPSLDESAAAGLAAVDAGADLLERTSTRWPTGPPSTPPRLAAGADPHGVLGVCDSSRRACRSC